MLLRNLLTDVPGHRVTGDPETGVRGLAYDSRSVEPGFLFAAVRGLQRDGNEFVEPAIRAGAAAVLSAHAAPTDPGPVAWVQVDDDRRALALVARNYYGRPDERMIMLGVTGTNGKTTVCFLLEAVLREVDLRPGLLGTVVYRDTREELRAERTTPESLDLYRVLDRFATGGARACVMEVSSHSLVLQRVAGINFKLGLFTNLTQDHLDFHGTMETYLEAKALLFRGLAPDAIAVLNADDPQAEGLRSLTPARVVTFGEARHADVRLEDVHPRIDGTEVRLAVAAGIDPGRRTKHRLVVRSPLLGRPNARNLAAAAAAGLALGFDDKAIVRGLESVAGVPGRFERVLPSAPIPFTVLVDYAHTDDALKNLLSAVRELRPRRVLTVFGCGGDRDRDKRPKMGFAAASGSDIVVVTSDNPRSEPPEAIIEAILPGVRRALTGDPQGKPDAQRCLVIPDRREAIRRVLELAHDGDCVVIAGKGHETYQILADRTIPFDDREVVREVLRLRGGGMAGRAAR